MRSPSPYSAAVAADDAYQRELVRVYGKAAGDMRYQSHKFTDQALIRARLDKLAADRKASEKPGAGLAEYLAENPLRCFQ